MRGIFVLFLLVAGLLIVPVAAQEESTIEFMGFETSNNKVLWGNSTYHTGEVIAFSAAPDAILVVDLREVRDDSTTRFIINQGQREHSGYITVQRSWFTRTVTLNLNGHEETYTRFPVLLPTERIIITYGKDTGKSEGDPEQYGLVVAAPGVIRGEYFVFQPVQGIGTQPMYNVALLNSDPRSWVEIVTADYGTYCSAYEELRLGRTPLLDDVRGFIDTLLSFLRMIWTFLLIAFMLFKFLFVDNFLTIIIAFEAVLMAWAAGTSRNFVAFAQKWIRANKQLADMLMEFIQRVVSIFFFIIRALRVI